MKLREGLRDKIKHIIGNGEHIFLWMDNWHPFGPLIERFGNRFIYASGIKRNAKVKAIIEDNRWKWPLTYYRKFRDIKVVMNDHLIGGRDCIWWLPSPKGNFSIKSTLNELRSKEGEINWASFIWYKKFIPRHAIILWLFH